MDYLRQLNDQQREAVLKIDGPVFVLAGAGSGKTRVITFRIAYLIDHVGVEPWRILAVTFTNKAADEMRHRVHMLLQGHRTADPPLISTFHSFCVRVLRRDIEALDTGYTRNFSIYDDQDSQRVIRLALRNLDIDEKSASSRSVLAAISHAKNRGLSATGYLADTRLDASPRTEMIGHVFQYYERHLQAANALDFDDLLLKTVDLFQHSNPVREYYNRRFHYLLIDEYQDTNRPQFNLMRHLTEHRRNLCVVGDPDQSIYRFRGADIQNILEFETHYPAAAVITLDRNYRSTRRILSVANHVIRCNTMRPEKSLTTENDQGPDVGYYHAHSAEDEAWFVARRIRTLLNRADGLGSKRAAVLYRTNAQSRLFEEALRRGSIGFNIVGGFSFYKRAEIRDIVAYLRLTLNLKDDESLARIINTPSRGIGQKTVESLRAIARDRKVSLWESVAMAVSEGSLPTRSLQSLTRFKELIESMVAQATSEKVSTAVTAVVTQTGYAEALKEKSLSANEAADAESRLSNLEEMVTAAVEAEHRGETLRQFVDHAALVSDADEYDPEAPVTLMTIHSAKGLEFPAVFIVGLEDGLFPHARCGDDPAEMEEERRLCYVAITRAQRELVLTHARIRRVRGEEMPTEPSQFLFEMPLDELEDHSHGPSWLASRVNPGRAETRPVKIKRAFPGKTFNTIESLEEFLTKKGLSVGEKSRVPERASPRRKKGLNPGARVRHPRYGIGQILKREGVGEDVKLTIRFPGFGERKLMERVADLEEL